MDSVGPRIRASGSLAPHGHVIVTAQLFSVAKQLYDDGAAFVYIPRLMSAKELRAVVEAALAGTIDKHRRIASAELSFRQEVLP
jgi:2-keto-3-deoxy-L-rhamnonate aldolase RhmA